MSKATSRRAILAGIIAASPALSASALATSDRSEVDPIFAAIERHRAAAAVLDAIIDEQAILEESLPRNKRKANCRDDDASSDDPCWEDHRRRYRAASDHREEAAQHLFEAPTSIAGYLDEIREQGARSWDDAWSLLEPEDLLSTVIDTVRRLQGLAS